ncbi:type II toxin-antitoxin system RelE/ParE family toxin [Arcicella sp. LKC2W]|uniref:type II toxin-antitoxin system RelE/ParE family toxin n=1 Tax=Arcicella sp. LKC2W TaxID=2984198 RepID=UPI002B1ECB17|nr:type II toxin-antitoxin system RelE/ParE family toxin [Arcicella sp. LKC2W]MEA5458281.1 type II toxin-antitoxin system RelE/ParE family toxin [Arcicella sp. LKC2W]
MTELIVTNYFSREAKPLAKKYRSLASEIVLLFESLKIDPIQGDALPLGCYKIRLAIESKGKGKRGGARVITHFHIKDDEIYLISIYDKSEQEDISDKELLRRLKALDLA